MGHLINPTRFRLGTSIFWANNWPAKEQNRYMQLYGIHKELDQYFRTIFYHIRARKYNYKSKLDTERRDPNPNLFFSHLTTNFFGFNLDKVAVDIHIYDFELSEFLEKYISIDNFNNTQYPELQTLVRSLRGAFGLDFYVKHKIMLSTISKSQFLNFINYRRIKYQRILKKLQYLLKDFFNMYCEIFKRRFFSFLTDKTELFQVHNLTELEKQTLSVLPLRTRKKVLEEYWLKKYANITEPDSLLTVTKIFSGELRNFTERVRKSPRIFKEEEPEITSPNTPEKIVITETLERLQKYMSATKFEISLNQLQDDIADEIYIEKQNQFDTFVCNERFPSIQHQKDYFKIPEDQTIDFATYIQEIEIPSETKTEIELEAEAEVEAEMKYQKEQEQNDDSLKDTYEQKMKFEDEDEDEDEDNEEEIQTEKYKKLLLIKQKIFKKENYKRFLYLTTKTIQNYFQIKNLVQNQKSIENFLMEDLKNLDILFNDFINNTNHWEKNLKKTTVKNLIEFYNIQFLSFYHQIYLKLKKQIYKISLQVFNRIKHPWLLFSLDPFYQQYMALRDLKTLILNVHISTGGQKEMIDARFIALYIRKLFYKKHQIWMIYSTMRRLLSRLNYLDGYIIIFAGRFTRSLYGTYKLRKKGNISFGNMFKLIDYQTIGFAGIFGYCGIKVFLQYKSNVSRPNVSSYSKKKINNQSTANKEKMNTLFKNNALIHQKSTILKDPSKRLQRVIQDFMTSSNIPFYQKKTNL